MTERPPWHGAVLEVPPEKPEPPAVLLPLREGDIVVTGHAGLLLVRIDFDRFFAVLDPFYALAPVERWAPKHRDQELDHFRSGKTPAAKVHASYAGRLSARVFGLEMLRLSLDAPGRPEIRIDRSWLRVAWRFEARTAFTDGRHRLRMMQHLGAPYGVVAVSPRQAPALAEICGWEEGRWKEDGDGGGRAMTRRPTVQAGQLVLDRDDVVWRVERVDRDQTPLRIDGLEIPTWTALVTDGIESERVPAAGLRPARLYSTHEVAALFLGARLPAEAPLTPYLLRALGDIAYGRAEVRLTADRRAGEILRYDGEEIHDPETGRRMVYPGVADFHRRGLIDDAGSATERGWAVLRGEVDG